MVWWIVGGTAVAAVTFVIWIWLELVNAPTIDDDMFMPLMKKEDDKSEA